MVGVLGLGGDFIIESRERVEKLLLLLKSVTIWSNFDDKLVWEVTRKGNFLVKYYYKKLCLVAATSLLLGLKGAVQG